MQMTYSRKSLDITNTVYNTPFYNAFLWDMCITICQIICCIFLVYIRRITQIPLMKWREVKRQITSYVNNTITITLFEEWYPYPAFPKNEEHLLDGKPKKYLEITSYDLFLKPLTKPLTSLKQITSQIFALLITKKNIF